MGVEVIIAMPLSPIAEALLGRKTPSETMASGGLMPSLVVSTAIVRVEGLGSASGISRASEGLCENGLGIATSSPIARVAVPSFPSRPVLGLSRTSPFENGNVASTSSTTAPVKTSEVPIAAIVSVVGRLAVHVLVISHALAV